MHTDCHALAANGTFLVTSLILGVEVEASVIAWSITWGLPLTLVGLPASETWHWFTWNQWRTLVPFGFLLLVGVAASVTAYGIASNVMGEPSQQPHIVQGLAIAFASQALLRVELRPVTPTTGHPSPSSILGAAAQRVQDHLMRMTERAQDAWIAELSDAQVVRLAHDIRDGYTHLAGRDLARARLPAAIHEQVKLLDARLGEAKLTDPQMSAPARNTLRNFCGDEFKNARRDRPTSKPTPFPGLEPRLSLKLGLVNGVLAAVRASQSQQVRIVTANSDMSATMVEPRPGAPASHTHVCLRPTERPELVAGSRVWIRVCEGSESVWCEATVTAPDTPDTFLVQIDRVLAHETRRHSPRAARSAPVLLRGQGDGQPPRTATLIDLAEAGARVRLAAPGPVLPSAVEITLDLGPVRVTTRGRVVRRDDELTVAVTLIDLTAQDRAELARSVLGEWSDARPAQRRAE